MSIGPTGGKLAVQMLRALGVSKVFGVPGGQTLAIMDAILDAPDLSFITARHETGAAVMADAYGRLTGTPGVCLATTGPGATNLLTGVGGALRDSSPMLVLTCNNNSADLGKDDAQNADHVAIFSSLVKYSRLVTRPQAIPQAIEEAWLAAVTGNPGPAHLDFTRDSVEGTIQTDMTIPDRHAMLSWSAQRPQPDSATLSKAAARIAAADHPVLWLGSGAARSGAGASALALAGAASIPVITTHNGIGSVPTAHPLVFGVHSRMGTALSHEVLRAADLVIAVGNSLNAVATSRWRLQLPDIIQVDIDPRGLGRYYAGQTLGIIGDAKVVLEQLLAELGRRDDEESRIASRRNRLSVLNEYRRKWQESIAAHASARTQGTISPVELVLRLSELAPAGSLLIADAGNPGLWSYVWEIHQQMDYLKPVGFGNMGFAVPAAVASAVINPERPVVALVGDGSLGMSLAELETLARVGGRTCLVVLNDAGYGNIRQEQQVIYGERRIGVDFADSDFSVIARALGLAAERIDSLSELETAARKALFDGSGPTLLDVPIDPAINVWDYPPFQPGTLQIP